MEGWRWEWKKIKGEKNMGWARMGRFERFV
jgi:hypothetical protein